MKIIKTGKVPVIATGVCSHCGCVFETTLDAADEDMTVTCPMEGCGTRVKIVPANVPSKTSVTTVSRGTQFKAVLDALRLAALNLSDASDENNAIHATDPKLKDLCAKALILKGAVEKLEQSVRTELNNGG